MKFLSLKVWNFEQINFTKMQKMIMNSELLEIL